MEIGRKGQFYIVAIVILVAVAVGIAYFTTESKQLQQDAEAQQEAELQNVLSSYAGELKDSVEGAIYSGSPTTFYPAIVAELQTASAERGYTLNATCVPVITGPTGQVDCTLTLTSGETSLSTSFTHSYSVPFDITPYADGNLTEENYVFLLGETVYYRLTTTSAANVTVTAYFPNGTAAYTANKTPSNYAAEGSFPIGAADPTGDWQLEANGTAGYVKKNFYVQPVSLSITAYDSLWNPQDTFARGETVRYRISVLPSSNVYVSVTAGGQARDYGWQSSSAATLHEGSFVISPFESSGTLLITATETSRYLSNSTTVNVLVEEYGTYIPLLSDYLAMDHTYDFAFSAACGYNTWYSENSTTQGSVPFVVYNSSTDNSVLRVDNGTERVDTPHIYANKVHVIASGCDTC